ncbi:MAG: ABC transporter permease [Deltaproteobacteria bacterium]|nr:ABC transporter permease [Deltaproteobacteria bacterium]
MQDIFAVYKKEISDHFSSYRFVILFALIAMVSLITSYMAGLNIKENLEGVAKPKFIFLMLYNTTGTMFSMVQFVAFFGPLIGIVLGFDSINRERSEGTLIKIISQPIYRDAIINGKFLAGMTTISIMLVSTVMVISGLGLMLLGIVPGVEEIWRLLIFVIVSVFYISFWLGLSILFSIFFKSVATSALAAVALWIFLSFFVSLGASVVADMIAPIDTVGPKRSEILIKNIRIKDFISLFSPMSLFSNASATIVDPMRNTTDSLVLMGPMEKISAGRFQNPLPILQSILVVYPYMVILIALTLVCFSISYFIFMVQEIRK